jgi:hypothetical protein
MCGAVRYRISAPPIATGLCHCNRCRPQSGSAFSTIIIINRSTFELEGETMVFEDVARAACESDAAVAPGADRRSRQNLT